MARNQDSNTWNQNHRYSQSDDRIMRRGDDRTRESRDWGSHSQDRNSYRTDDYPTDKEMYRAGEDRYDRDMAYGNYGSRNNQMHGQQNFTQQGSAPYTFNPDRGGNSSYGWSGDYRSSQEYRPSHDRESSSSGSGRWGGSDSQGYDRSYGRQDNMYGQGGDLSSSRSFGSGMSSFGSSTSESLRGGAFGSSGYGSSTSSTGSYGSALNYGSGFGAGSSSGLHSGKGPKNYRRSDDRIKEDVSDALERNPQIDASEIELDVKDGVVTLRGHVEDRPTKRMAEDVVAGMYGVKDVRNELTVDQSIFTQARNMIFGESAESQSASSTNANKSTATRSKH